MLKLCRITNFNLFFSFLEITLWLHIVLGVTISRDPLLQKAYPYRPQFLRQRQHWMAVPNTTANSDAVSGFAATTPPVQSKLIFVPRYSWIDPLFAALAPNWPPPRPPETQQTYPPLGLYTLCSNFSLLCLCSMLKNLHYYVQETLL